MISEWCRAGDVDYKSIPQTEREERDQQVLSSIITAQVGLAAHSLAREGGGGGESGGCLGRVRIQRK